MDLLTILSVVRIGRELIEWVMNQVAILRAKGDITAEQYAAIKAAAGLADAQWDAAVVAAKQRLGQTR